MYYPTLIFFGGLVVFVKLHVLIYYEQTAQRYIVEDACSSEVATETRYSL